MQGRYKGILIEPDSYALELSRYIHLNPVRAKVVKKTEDYLWSSYQYYLDVSRKPEWLDTDLILSYFGNVKPERIQKYRIFTEEAVEKKHESPLKNVVGSVLLGGDKFIREIKNKYIKDVEVSRDLPSIRSLKRMNSMEEIVKVIDEESGIQDKNLHKKLVIYMSHRFSGIYTKDIGQYFGVSESAVSKISIRFERDIENNAGLRLIIGQIKNKILS